jgi:ABC-type thiamine transport system ATPase subunit
MKAAEDAADELTVALSLFERDQVAVQLIESFSAFDQELRDNVVELTHVSPLR